MLEITYENLRKLEFHISERIYRSRVFGENLRNLWSFRYQHSWILLYVIHFDSKTNYVRCEL